MADSNSKNMSQPAGKGGEPVQSAINPKLIEQVGVTLEAFLGDAKMTVGELAALKQGATVELDTELGQAVELRLNGVTVARGELVAAGDRFAVRLVEVSS